MKIGKSVVCKCERCNKPFKAYEEQEHPLCRECRALRNSAFERRVCKDCGREFTITVGEKEFYESKSLFLPVRCRSCRKIARRMVVVTGMAKCTGRGCPMQVGYKINECNHEDCPYRTEPITNADRIRAMSDEELATILGDKCICPPASGRAEVCGDCVTCWLEWLQQQAEPPKEG